MKLFCKYCKGSNTSRNISPKGKTIICRDKKCGKEHFIPARQDNNPDRFKKSQDFIG